MHLSKPYYEVFKALKQLWKNLILKITRILSLKHLNIHLKKCLEALLNAQHVWRI